MTLVRDDLVERLQSIDTSLLGERLRAARLRTGLTQAQVAGDDVSVGYVSRIESGQRRPDGALLERLAGRLRVTLDELLLGLSQDRAAALHLEVDHAELALATGSPDDALERVGMVLAGGELADLPVLQRRAHYVQAGALEATGDLQGAILLLEDLAETEPFDPTWIDGLTALSRCYRESGELGRAVEVGRRGEGRIADLSLESLDESVRLTVTMAAAYFEQGDVDYAARLCRRAVDRAEKMNSPMAKAMAYWNSSAMESLRGDVEAALPMARRALEVISASEDARNAARLRTQLGILQLKLDTPEPEAALAELTRAAQELTYTQAGPVDTAENHLAQARAQFLLGNVDRARILAAETIERARADLPLVAADTHVLLGQIEAHEGVLDRARAQYQQAVLLLSALGADRTAAQLWFELAGLLEDVGDPAAALDSYKRAGAATGLVAPSRSTTPIVR